MPSSDLYRRTVFFLIFAGIVIIVLMLLPFVETRTAAEDMCLGERFGPGLPPDGQVVITIRRLSRSAMDR
jgi:hypothetical protein